MFTIGNTRSYFQYEDSGLDRSELTDRVGKLSRPKLELVLSGVDVVLGR